MKEPLDQFDEWFQRAEAADVAEPEAMALATASRDGKPSLRIVFYRGRTEHGIRFFTNYEGRKGQELFENPFAAATFYWRPLALQVRFEGSVERLNSAESDEYFANRPRRSQLGAWASPQSRPLPYSELEQRVAELDTKYTGSAIPRPAHWGGFVIIPTRIEFWEGVVNRLHKRSVFTRSGATWEVVSIAP